MLCYSPFHFTLTRFCLHEPWKVESLIGRMTLLFVFQLKVSSPTVRAILTEIDGGEVGESKASADSLRQSSSSPGSSSSSPSLNSGNIINQ